jgi:hypothetical protein
MAFGTLSVFDTIGARQIAAGDLLKTYDEQQLTAEVQRYLNIHNALMQEMVNDLVVPTIERLMTWTGVADQINMIRADEFSRPDVQKNLNVPVTMGIPLYNNQVGWGVTRLFMQTKTIGDLERIILGVTDADKRDMLNSIGYALFHPTNNTAYLDRRVDSAALTLRALLNADSTYIPPDQYGNTFNPATHTHYLATASFIAANLTSLVTTVMEHYPRGSMRVYINSAQETTVRGFTGFYPYFNPALTVANNITVANGQALDMSDPYNRAIGIFDVIGGAQVWVKPWVPPNYVFAYNTDAPKPLAMRTRDAEMGSLHIAADFETFPLRAQFLEHEYGVSVIERSNGAVLYTGSGTYAEPTFAY